MFPSFPSSNSSSSTRDNFHYSQSPLISWCINNNCKRRDATRRAGADKVAVTRRGGTLTQTAAASHHLPLSRQQKNFSGKRTHSPASEKTRENGKVCNFEGITNKNPSLTIAREHENQSVTWHTLCYWFSSNRVTECWKIEHLAAFTTCKH